MITPSRIDGTTLSCLLFGKQGKREGGFFIFLQARQPCLQDKSEGVLGQAASCGLVKRGAHERVRPRIHMRVRSPAGVQVRQASQLFFAFPFRAADSLKRRARRLG
jgi:hypothetical protein